MLQTLSPLPMGIRTLTTEEHVRLTQRNPNIPMTPKDCVTCAGDGKFLWYADGSDDVVEYECPCQEQWVLTRFLSHCGVPLAYQRLGWRDAQWIADDHVMRVYEYIERARQNVTNGWGLIFTGHNGNGKSMLATLLQKGLAARGYEGFFATMGDMIDMYTSGWREPEEKAWFHRRVRNAKILVLDDLGKEFQGSNRHGLPEATFDAVLRYRVGAALPTIITTNKSEEKIHEGYGGAIMSLLSERATVCEFLGEDVRPKHRERLRREQELGLTRPVTLT